MKFSQSPLRVAILDLYNREANEGMRAIQGILEAPDPRYRGRPIHFDKFDVRCEGTTPGLDYDVYISSGGPGSPFEGIDTAWESSYFRWIEAIWKNNQSPDTPNKHVIFICHSFQLMCRYFELGQVTRRRSKSFGILPVHKTEEGRTEPLFEGLKDPFFAADFRDWQVVQPDHMRIAELGGDILALEKKRPQVNLERAVMAIRLTPEIIGTQFHPEADPPGMIRHFSKPSKKAQISEAHGKEKYDRILSRLHDPEALLETYRTVLPRFIARAIEKCRPASLSHLPVE